MSILVGIDPGSGKSSNTAIACFNSSSKEIYFCVEIEPTVDPKKDPFHFLLNDLAAQLAVHMGNIKKLAPNKNSEVHVYIENFVMRGKGGQVLNQAVGALLSRIPMTFSCTTVMNTSVKALVAGNGKADKVEVASGVVRYFKANGHPESADFVQDLLDLGYYDRTDAFAIAIAGHARRMTKT